MNFAKKQIQLIVTTVLSLSLATVSTATESPDHPAAHFASPDIYSEIMQNDHVRVLTMTLQPGQIDRWHHHPNETVYFTQGGTLKIHLPDGGLIVKEVAPGEVMWHEAWVHRVENAGSTKINAVIVEDVTSSK